MLNSFELDPSFCTYLPAYALIFRPGVYCVIFWICVFSVRIQENMFSGKVSNAERFLKCSPKLLPWEVWGVYSLAVLPGLHLGNILPIFFWVANVFVWADIVTLCWSNSQYSWWGLESCINNFCTSELRHGICCLGFSTLVLDSISGHSAHTGRE